MSKTAALNQRGFSPLILLFIIPIVVIVGLTLNKTLLNHQFAKDPAKLPPMTTDPNRSHSDQINDKKETLPNGKILYINFTSNYSIEIPQNWHIYPQSEMQDYYFYATSPDDHSISVRVETPKKSNPLKEYYEEKFNTLPNIKIEGYNAVKVVIDSYGRATEPYYEISYIIRTNPDVYYDLKIGSGWKSAVENNMTTINKIVDSFKILDKTEEPITKRTFSNPNVGYSFKYPSNWLVNTFQNNGNYNLGITVVDENDKEMLTLVPRPKERDCTFWGAPPYEVDLPFQNKVHHLSYQVDDQCPQPYIKTKNGYEYRINASVYDPKNIDPDLIELLNSFEGVSLKY